MTYELDFVGSLALTIMIESVVLWLMIDRIYKQVFPLSSIFFTGILASAATLPYVWFIFPVFISTHWIYVTMSESFAILVETLIIQQTLRIGIKKSLVLSFVCNSISFAIGLIVF